MTMTDHPINVVFVDSAAVAKGDVRAFERNYNRLRAADANWVRARNLSDVFGVDIGGSNYDRDPSDTTSADNGTSVIVDSAGSRFIKTAQSNQFVDDIFLTDTSSNRIWFGTAGVAVPGAGSVGEKIQLYGTSGTAGSTDYAFGIETNYLWFNTASGFKWYVNSSAEVVLDSASLSPANNDGSALGTTALSWSDLCLASGAVINFNNGDVTLTHSADVLAFAGATTGYQFDSPIDLVESSSPANPAADHIKLFAKDVSGVTHVFSRDSAGNEQDMTLGGGGAVAATQAEMAAASSTSVFVSPGRHKFSPSAAKVWVSFNGTGTVAIRVSYNVSSITDNGVGDYTVNFSTAFATADYVAVSGAMKYNTTFGTAPGPNTSVPTTSAYRFSTISSAAANFDPDYVMLAFFGTQ